MMDHFSKEYQHEFSTDDTKMMFDQISLDAIVTSLHQTKAGWVKTQAELHQTQAELHQTQANLAETKSELLHLHQTLADQQKNYATLQEQHDVTVAHQEVAIAQAASTLTDKLQQDLDLQRSEHSVLKAELVAMQKELVAEGQEIASKLDQMKSQAKVKSKLINEFHKQSSQLRHQNDVLNQQTQKLQDRVNLVTTRMRDRKAEFAEALSNLEGELEYFKQEVARLQVGREAFKEVIKSFLRRTKLGSLLFPNKFKLNDMSQDAVTQVVIADSISSQLPVNLSKESSATEEASDTNNSVLLNEPKIESNIPTVQDNLASNVVEDFVMLRGLSSSSTEIQPEVLELLSGLMLEPRNVLCIRPSRKLGSFVQSLTLRQHQITCVDCTPDFLANFASSGITTTAESLMHWMTNNDRSYLLDFDLILIGQVPWSEINPMLSGRLSQGAKLITHGSLETDAMQINNVHLVDWIQSSVCHEDLHFYKDVPYVWCNSFDKNLTKDEYRRWPWNFPSIKCADTLPSGKPWPKISVVTVTLNQGEYLEETIRSVLLQEYPNLEYIVLDGCSTDNTSSILERYRDEIAHCIIEPDKGQSDALNKGFKLATGDILAWLNSDDCYLPGSLFRVAIAFDAYQSDMVVGGCQLRHGFNPVPVTTHHTALPIGQVVPLPIDRLLDLDNCWQKGEFFYQPEVFWTRDLWQRSGGKVEEDLFYSMDYELWVRMAYHNAHVVHVPDSFTLFRLHEEQKTHGDDIPFLPELRSVCAQYQEKIQE